jgi:hypothetical protein
MSVTYVSQPPHAAPSNLNYLSVPKILLKKKREESPTGVTYFNLAKKFLSNFWNR